MSPADERTERVRGVGAALGAEWVILTSVDSVAYAVGHYVGIETGPSPFEGGPTTAVVGPQGELAIVANELERAAAQASRAELTRFYESLGFDDPTPLHDKYARATRELLLELGIRGRIAIERRSLPLALAEALREAGATLVACDRELARARAVKTGREIDALRRAAAITACGQEATRRSIRPGITELELFREVRGAMEDQMGQRLPIAGDLVSGRARTAAVGGWPTLRLLADGDPVISDLAPRVAGYWGDSCTTLAVGDATHDFERMYAVVHRAIEQAAAELRPDLVIADFDASIRRPIVDSGYSNPIHVGHGIGTSVHEWPRIVPGERARFEPDMILMVEPGAYHPDIGGVRLERMFRVTRTGNEILSPFAILPSASSATV